MCQLWWMIVHSGCAALGFSVNIQSAELLLWMMECSTWCQCESTVSWTTMWVVECSTCCQYESTVSWTVMWMIECSTGLLSREPTKCLVTRPMICNHLTTRQCFSSTLEAHLDFYVVYNTRRKSFELYFIFNCLDFLLLINLLYIHLFYYLPVHMFSFSWLPSSSFLNYWAHSHWNLVFPVAPRVIYCQCILLLVILVFIVIKLSDLYREGFSVNVTVDLKTTRKHL